MTDREPARPDAAQPAEMADEEYGPDNWAPPFSSPEASRAHTAATLPHSEREAFLASLEPVTDEMRDRPYYGSGPRDKADPEREAGS